MNVKPSSQMRPGVAAKAPQQKFPFPPIGDLAPKPAQPFPLSTPHLDPKAAQPAILSTPVDYKGDILDSQWDRIAPLSNGIFNPGWDTISVKHFNAFDQAKLARAVRKQNLTLLLDILSATCNCDVRDMAYSDFQGVCYWHKRNDYLQVKQTLGWNSRYGIRARAEVRKTKLNEVYLDATAEEYREWQKKGLRAATCRELELMLSGNLDEDTLYLFDKAQHIDPAPLSDRIEQLRKGGDKIASITARVEELNRRGLQFWDTIEEFVLRFSDYGLQETAVVQIKDSDFNPFKAIEFLRASGDDERIEEANLIQTHLDTGKTYTPREEEVPLSFDVWSMFPYTGA
jgi:hypothetical protein